MAQKLISSTLPRKVVYSDSASICNVVVSEPNPEKRATAVEMGADLTVDPSKDDAAEYIRTNTEKNDGLGVAATLDFVGLPQTMEFALSLLRKGGHHVHVGLFGGAYSLSMPPLAFKMLRISGSYVGTLEEFRELVELVKSGMDLSIPITNRPLTEAADALRDLKDGTIVGRIVLNP